MQIDADPDPAYHFNADPDPAVQLDADPDPQHWSCLENNPTIAHENITEEED